jgi:predicted DNA repair protein MutK
MASGFFAILDDIALLMDDVASMSKIATKKTAGILGDDLAVNAEKATGFVSSREIPVLWAITKGSAINKLIILPVVFLLNFYFPEAVKIILILGGLFLAYEGAEKIIEFLFHKKNQASKEEVLDIDVTQQEKIKIKSAIKTDFILSLEIVIIALSTVFDKDLTTQILVVSVVALIATVGVYGIVALIVRMDDAGLVLIKKSNDQGFFAGVGHGLVKLLPIIIRTLAVVGTIALLLVSGGIFAHNSHYLHDLFHGWPELLRDFTLGLVIGSLVVGLVHLAMMFKKKSSV